MTNKNLTDERIEWLIDYLSGDVVSQFAGIDTVQALRELQQYRKVAGVPFYRDGIIAAAQWVDQQRESYDSEHGRHDPDTGSFEFGNDAQQEYSSTLADIAEGIRALHPTAAERAKHVRVYTGQQPLTASMDMFTDKELDLLRQWYNAVKDLNPKYLDIEGFQDTVLYHKVQVLQLFRRVATGKFTPGEWMARGVEAFAKTMHADSTAQEALDFAEQLRGKDQNYDTER